MPSGIRHLRLDAPAAPDEPGAVAVAAETLVGGGTVVLPTDTVYGLAALPTLPGATEALFELKDRAAGQAVAVLVADLEQALELVEEPGDDVIGWMERFWPGPLTIVLQRSPAALGFELGGEPDTVGVRCPAHPFVRAVAAEVGPIATTSANRSGEPTPTSALEAAAALTGLPDLVVDGGPAGSVASTVVDASRATWRILREGAITAQQLHGLD